MTRREGKKIGITIIILVVFITGIFTFNICKIHKEEQETTLLLKQATNQEMYNKLMVSKITISNLKTGTAPFDTGTPNLDGADTSETDDVIRTFDNIEYTLAASVIKNPEANLPEGTILKGGIMKIKATLPNIGSKANLTWIPNTWMHNTKISPDGSVLTTEYVIEDTVDTTSLYQTLTFTIRVGGRKENITTDKLPQFEIWMEGNQPDDPTSQTPSKKISATTEIKVSAKYNFYAHLSSSGNTEYTGNRNIKGNNVEGLYATLGFGLRSESLNDATKDLRGTRLPEGEIKVGGTIKYSYRAANDTIYHKLDETTPNTLGLANGIEMVHYGPNGQASDKYLPNNWRTIGSGELPYGIGEIYHYKYNTGDLNATITDNKFEMTFNNYKVAPYYPVSKYDDPARPSINPDYGYIVMGNYEIFIPYYNTEVNDSFAIKIQIDYLSFVDEFGKEVIISMPNSKADTNYHTVPDLDNTHIESEKYRDTSGYKEMTSRLDQGYGKGDGSALIGEEFKMRSYLYISGTRYYGGTSHLVMWDPKMSELIKNNGIWYTFRDANFKTDIEFGVLTANPKEGLTGLDNINNATKKDFTWYKSYEEATSKGLVTAIVANNYSYDASLGISDKLYVYFKHVNNAANVGKISIFKNKVYYYEDVERTKCVEAKDFPYVPAVYDPVTNDLLKTENSEAAGEGVKIVGIKSKGVLTLSRNNVEKYKYDVNENYVRVTLHNYYEIKEPVPGLIYDRNKLIVVIPNGFEYVDKSATQTPESITKVKNGTQLIFDVGPVVFENGALRVEKPKIQFKASMLPTLENNTNYYFEYLKEAKYDDRVKVNKRYGTIQATITNLPSVSVNKRITSNNPDIGDKVKITDTITNYTNNILSNVILYSNLPNKNTGSNITGKYSITIKSISPNAIVNFADATTNKQIKVGDTIEINGPAKLIGKTNQLTKNEILEVAYEINTNNLNALDNLISTSSMAFTPPNSKEETLTSNDEYLKVSNRKLEAQITLQNESHVLPPIKVELLDNTGKVLQTKNTLNNIVQFDKLTEQKYKIRFIIPEQFEIVNKELFDKNNTTINSVIPTYDFNVYNDNNYIKLNLKIKRFTLTQNYYKEGTKDKLVESKVTELLWGDTYKGEPLVNPPFGYELKEPTKIPEGTIKDNVTLDYYYRLKDAKVIAHHYAENSTTEVAPTETINTKWGKEYTTTKATDKLNSNYEFKSAPSNAKGTVASNTTEVIYYYKLKTATITVNHYIENTTTKVADTVTFTKKYTENYETQPATTDLNKNYQLKTVPSNATGPVSGNITVNYYYELKSGTITVKYLETGTDKELAPEVKITKKWTEKYETSPSDKVSSNYNLVETPSDAKGTVSGNKTIIYYYKLKTGTITVNHYKEGSTEKLADTITFTKNYTDKYTTSVSSNVSSNYELVAEPDNKYGTVSGNVTVNYYYKLKTATIKVRFLESGTNKSLADEVTFTKKYTETYTVTPSDKVSQNYEIVTRPTETGVVKGDVTLTYYYKLKGANLTVHHYLENSTTKLASDENQALKWGETYKTNVNKSLLTNYELVAEPKNASGTIANDKVEVIYYYRHRIGTITVKYLETGTEKELATETKITKNYGDTYKVTPSDRVSTNYELIERPTESGKVSGNVTLTYYYKIKKAKITVHHYIENSTTELAATEETIMSWGETYNTSSSSKINKNYELVSEPKDKTGTVAGDKVINYYYRLKKSKITVKYLETGTNNKLTEDIIIDSYWGKKYTTSPSSKVGPAYELISTPTNYEGTVESNSIEVIYYYQKKDSSLTGTLEFSATSKIDSINKSIKYKYTFEGNITDFYGLRKDYKTEIKFPYDIDKDKTKLPTGWNYDGTKIIYLMLSEAKTPVDGTLAPDGKDKFHIGDELEIYFVGIKPTDREITASIKAMVTLEGGKSLTKSAPVKTAVEVKGNIITHHYLEGTQNKINDDVTATDLVGNNYISKPINKKGYLLVKKPEVEDLTYTIETQEVIYEYKKISLQIKTSHTGDGSITGDEEVLFGNSSTKDKIVIKPNPGFEVGEITINGKIINKECKKGCVLGAFDEVIEDKNIKVTFIKESIIENPETSEIITPVAILTFTGIAAGSVYVYRKYKLKNSNINKL